MRTNVSLVAVIGGLFITCCGTPPVDDSLDGVRDSISTPPASFVLEPLPTAIIEPVETAMSVAVASIADRIPMVRFDGPFRESPNPLLGTGNDLGIIPMPAAGFVPAAADAEFCEAVAVINGRPQPAGDDFSQVAVAAQYFGAIETFVPPDLGTSFQSVLGWVNGIVAQGSFTPDDQPGEGDEVTVAVEVLNSAVDQRCLGRS